MTSIRSKLIPMLLLMICSVLAGCINPKAVKEAETCQAVRPQLVSHPFPTGLVTAEGQLLPPGRYLPEQDLAELLLYVRDLEECSK